MSKYEELQERLLATQSTWLVTGCAGFIGSNLLEKLLILNQKVVGLDNFSTGYQYNIDQAIEDAASITGKSIIQLKQLFTFIEGDIVELSDCQNACQGVDYVLHQAALGSVPRSIENPLATSRANIDGFLNMLVAAKSSKVKRFVYAASSSTYGDHPNLPKVEDTIGNPLSPYAVTKYVNELYASVFAKIYGFESIGLRYFNIFGKRQDQNGSYAAVIPKWVSAILNSENVFINGDGETSRDFCFIDNAVQINLLAATTESSDATNQVYNVALNDKTSLNQLHHLIQSKLMDHTKGLVNNKPIYRDFRKGDVKHSQADISKAVKLLCYQPKYRIAEGMNETIDWYLRKIKSI